MISFAISDIVQKRILSGNINIIHDLGTDKHYLEYAGIAIRVNENKCHFSLLDEEGLEIITTTEPFFTEDVFQITDLKGQIQINLEQN
jgi:hypothetical protein